MKAFISIDMEGICGVVSEIETDPIKGGEAYQRNRHLMTKEANAAVEGCLKAGATEVLVAGDGAVTAEAKALIGNVHTVAVKDATVATAARNLHPKKAREQIRNEAASALREAKTIAPLRAKSPIRMVVEFRGTYAVDRAAMIPTVRRIGGLRLEFEAADYPDAFRTFYAMVTIAGGD